MQSGGYIKFSKLIEENLFFDTLQKQLKSSLIYKQKSEFIFYFLVEKFDNLVSILKILLKVLITDFNIDMAVLITPYEDDNIFLRWIPKVELGAVETSFTFALTNFPFDLEIKRELATMFTEVSKELLETIDFYIDSGLNAALTSKRLFVHRNTFNYRLQKFIDISKVDVTDVNNAMLFKLYRVLDSR